MKNKGWIGLASFFEELYKSAGLVEVKKKEKDKKKKDK